jgi:methenyltetrahydromethanopterin cyclohydrolase
LDDTRTLPPQAIGLLASSAGIGDHSGVKLNLRALHRCAELTTNATPLRVGVLRDETGARLIDCGVHVAGGLEAGRLLAEVCMAGLGQIQLVPGDSAVWLGPAVAVRTDQPIAACMASQYAGWQIAGENFFAMGSGPMRAVRRREALFESIGFHESSADVVGVLESSRLPPADVCHQIAAACQANPENVTLLVAPTASLAGTIQIVARTIETALHKMHELGFDLTRAVAGFGHAPLPPVAADDLSGIGRTNDAVLYGGRVSLWVRGDDASLESLGPQIPSSASSDHGQPFREIFDQYDRDFYKIDPLLFSPAEIQLINVDSGHVFRFGQTHPEILRASFEA